MKLPLFLCGALAAVLTGCEGTCTASRCTISSMMSAGNSTLNSSSPQNEASVITRSRAPERYQPVAPRSTPTASSFVAPPIIEGGCESAAYGEYDLNVNTIRICQPMDAAMRRAVIAHEMGHAVDWQEDRQMQPDSEYWADQYAVNSLLQKSDCEAIAARARFGTSKPSDYTKGTYYAREMHSAHC